MQKRKLSHQIIITKRLSVATYANFKLQTLTSILHLFSLVFFSIFHGQYTISLLHSWIRKTHISTCTIHFDSQRICCELSNTWCCQFFQNLKSILIDLNRFLKNWSNIGLEKLICNWKINFGLYQFLTNFNKMFFYFFCF